MLHVYSQKNPVPKSEQGFCFDIALVAEKARRARAYDEVYTELKGSGFGAKVSAKNLLRFRNRFSTNTRNIKQTGAQSTRKERQ